MKLRASVRRLHLTFTMQLRARLIAARLIAGSSPRGSFLAARLVAAPLLAARLLVKPLLLFISSPDSSSELRKSFVKFKYIGKTT